MKKIFTVFLLCIFHFNCTAQWVELNVGNANASNFTDVYAITPDIVVVVGSNGTILKTTDGGTTWQQKDSGTNQYLQKVRFSNANVGYVIGDQGTLLKTTNGGETWISINTGFLEYFAALSSVGDNLVYIAYNNHLLKSEDGGLSWNNYPLDFYNDGSYNSEIQFLTPNVGYASKMNQELSKTTNGGETWQELTGGSSAFYFINENVGLCNRSGLVKTTDGGNNFIGLGGSRLMSKIFAVNENTAWGFMRLTLDGSYGGIGKMSYSSENGYIVSYEYNSNTEMKKSLYFSNDKLGYAVGYKNGKAAIWKNTTGNTMAINESQFKDSINIYPNPASNEVSVDLRKDPIENLNISIVDITGKVVYFQSHISDRKIKINTSNLTKGIYLFIVETNQKKYAKKLIIQ